MTVRSQQERLGELVGGKYRIVRFLAAGGMGVVYEAQHTVVRRRFAVKFLHPEMAARRDILTRFEREAGAAGALESENVTAAVDFGIVTDGTPYIVMEYLVGENLARLLAREGRLPVRRAADLCVQACRGMQAAHAAGIVHRDLKPQNLFVCRRDDGTDLLKVLDFGVAKLQAVSDDSVATRTGAVLGTPSYMSPEQARGDKVVDHRADVYSLGAIFYELVSGQRPHPGDSHNAVLYHISTQPAVSLESVEPGLPEGLAEVVALALRSDPQARTPTAEALGSALAPFAKREVWPEAKGIPDAYATGSKDSVPAETPSSRARTPSVERPPTTPTTTSRSPRLRAITTVAAAAIVAAVFAVALRSQRQLTTQGPTPSVATAAAPTPSAPAAAPTRPVPESGPPVPPSERTERPAPAISRVTAAARAAARTRPRGAAPAAATALATPEGAAAPNMPASPTAPAAPVTTSPAPSRPAPVTFDQQNPYN